MNFFAPINKKWLETAAQRGNAYSLGQTPDRVPVDILLTPGHSAYLFGIPRHDVYTNPSLGVKAMLAASELYDIVPSFTGAGTTHYCEDYGGKVKMPTGYTDAPYIEEYPLKTPEDIDELEVMDVDEISKGPTLTRIWEALETAEKLLGPFFTPHSNPWTPYDLAANLLEPEKLLRWTIRMPEIIHKLLRKVVELEVNVNKAVIRKYGRCTIDTGSVLANSAVLSPKQTEEFQINYLREMVERSLKAGAGPGIIYHLCGDHSLDWRLFNYVPITPQTTMQVANFGRKSADLTEVIKLFGKKCIIVGNISTTLILFGTPREIYEEAKNQVLSYKNSPRGFILAPACNTPTLSPPGNVHALVRAAVDHGKLSKA